MTETLISVINAEQLLEHWQGHRKLTRKVIEAFPEDKLFSYSIGGMRSFSDQVMEIIDLAEAGAEGAATGNWKSMNELMHVNGNGPKSKEDILTLWDSVTAKINSLWPQISAERFAETDKAFGVYEGTVYSSLLYFIDNEIHHRAQGYVYLRSLGITPPPFWERY